MADELDVAGRLSEGRQAVENAQNYVWASHLLDYQNPDLTLHSAQVRDWFGTEDGLDLHALDADRSAFDAVAGAAHEVLRVQRVQVDLLATAWSGAGAETATDFLRRHTDAAASVAATARTAADALAGLRDNLCEMVDGKVAAVTSIDDRRQGERPAWLSASQTVITGTGDRAAASELVDLQVKPFVDNDIRIDWLNALRATIASIANSYDAANAELSSSALGRFEIPGELGPSWSPPADAGPAPTGGTAAPSPPAAASTPAAAPTPPVAPASPPPVPAPPPPVAAPAPVAPPATVPPATAPSAGIPELPGLPLGGLTGPGQGLADTFGGLLPSRNQGLPEPPAVDPPEDDEPRIGEALADGADATDAEDDPDDPPEKPDEPESAAVEPEPAPPPPPPEPAPEPPPEPLSAPPADEPSTPCEIAADQLPQVGQ